MNPPSLEASRSSFFSQNKSQVETNPPNPPNRIIEKKASKSIYGRIHKIIGNNKS